MEQELHVGFAWTRGHVQMPVGKTESKQNFLYQAFCSVCSPGKVVHLTTNKAQDKPLEVLCPALFLLSKGLSEGALLWVFWGGELVLRTWRVGGVLNCFCSLRSWEAGHLSTISISKQDGCAWTDERPGGRKLRQVSQQKVASKGTHKDAGCHGDTEKEGQAALAELGLSGWLRWSIAQKPQTKGYQWRSWGRTCFVNLCSQAYLRGDGRK